MGGWAWEAEAWEAWEQEAGVWEAWGLDRENLHILWKMHIVLPLVVIPVASGIKHTVWAFPFFSCRLSRSIFAFFLLKEGRVDEIDRDDGNDHKR